MGRLERIEFSTGTSGECLKSVLPDAAGRDRRSGNINSRAGTTALHEVFM
jgi:hypothetical protein